MKKSLCVFYPVQYQETFGLVAAEANALGVPLVTHPKAALKEVVSSDLQFAETDAEIVQKVVDWHKHGRPEVSGRDEFKYKDVLMDWVRLLARESKIITKI
jgi:glycosyltransferase involved in cell wall biosynthesis